MRDYPGLSPWHVDGVVGLTRDELFEIVADQNARWKALADAERKQKRTQQRRRG